ncbi:MAG: acyl-CoA dehydrogenase family protein [Niveispirillum sp.]|nr:acyl-CoA dehydrogenase family protein [Niveispirillum sp.]
MERMAIFNEDHESFRTTVRRFCEERVAPNQEAWADEHRVPPEIWREAGGLGLLCAWLPEEYGGTGTDIRFDLVVCEELARIGATGPGFPLHSLIVAPYIAEFGGDALKQRLLPAMARGEKIGAIAMTEPGAGSDLAGIRTMAVPYGDGWRINGQKTFITNGHNADIIIVACITDPGKGAHGISLIIVESGTPGFSRGRNLRKMGQHAQDTAELFFDDVIVPGDNLLGEAGKGFIYMMEGLPQERLVATLLCQGRAEAALATTIAYTADRRAFGKRIIDFQNTRFKLAEMQAQIMAGRAFCDQLVMACLSKRLSAVDAAAGKLWHSEMLGRVVDECVQLHGGYGYMMEYPITRAYVDARIERIYGGTSEIMKEVIARDIVKHL